MKSATYTLIAFATLSCAYDLAIPAYKTIRFWLWSPWRRIQSTMKHLTGYWFGRLNLDHSACAPSGPKRALSSRSLSVIEKPQIAPSSMQQSTLPNTKDVRHTRHIASDLARHVHFAERGSVHHKIRVIDSRCEQNIAATIAQYLSDHCSELMHVKPDILRAQLMPCIQLSLINEALMSEPGDCLPGTLSQAEQESMLCFRSYCRERIAPSFSTHNPRRNAMLSCCSGYFLRRGDSYSPSFHLIRLPQYQALPF